MLNHDQHILLALIADDQPHSFFEVSRLGAVALKKNDRKIWTTFKRMLEYGWAKRLGKSPFEHTDFYQITPKGDQLFRATQIFRITRGKHTEDLVRHFRLFNRQSKGKYGAEGLGEHLTERKAGLPDRLPHLYS